MVAGLLGCNLLCEQSGWHVDIDECAADEALNVIVPIHALIEAARPVPEGKIKDEPAFGQQVPRPLDRPIRDRWVLPVHAFEDLPGGEVASARPHLVEDRRALRRHTEVVSLAEEFDLLGHR